MKIAYVGPDWYPGVSRHVVSRGATDFIQALGRHPEVDLTKVSHVDEIEKADALVYFHHCKQGFTMYENPVYTRLLRDTMARLPEMRIPKFAWHVEPKPTFDSISRRQVQCADVVLSSSAVNMFGDRPTIYVPNGVRSEVWEKKTRFLSAPMNIIAYVVAGRASPMAPGGRLEQLLHYMKDREIDLYGMGWDEWVDHIPKHWRVHPSTVSREPFGPYAYVAEVLEREPLEQLNPMGYCSDRVGLALAHGCHLVTNLTWMKSVYESVVLWDELNDHVPEFSAVKRDAEKFSWDNIVRNIVPALCRHRDRLIRS